MSNVELIDGEYYWLRVKEGSVIYGLKFGELYVGLYRKVENPTIFNKSWFDLAGNENPPDADYFDVLEIVQYEDNK